MTSDELMAGLPGEALVREGLADLSAGLRTVPALLVSIARPRLSKAGLLPPPDVETEAEEAELALYAQLRNQGGDPYAKYNALIRELVSFEQALDHRLSRSRTQS